MPGDNNPYPNDAPPPARPGDPGYDAYKAYWEAHGQHVGGGSGNGNGGFPGQQIPGSQNHPAPQGNGGGGFDFNQSARDVWNGAGNTQGEHDPNRTMDYGNRGGYGDGSRFQADFNRLMNGSWSPEATQVNMNAGQVRGDANGDQSRAMQLKLMQQLQDQAAGNGPSIAQLQLQKGGDQAMAQASSLAASQRGAGQAGMLKGIAQQQSRIGQGMANDAAMLRLQEQMQARTQLGTGLSSMRGLDQSQSQFNASAQQKAEQMRLDLYKAQQEMQAQAAQRNSISGMIGGITGSVSMMGSGKK